MIARRGPNRGVLLAAWVTSAALAYLWGHSRGASECRQETRAPQTRPGSEDQASGNRVEATHAAQSAGPSLQGLALRPPTAPKPGPDDPPAEGEVLVPGRALVRQLMDRTRALLAQGPSGRTALLRLLSQEAEAGELLAWFYSDRAGYVGAKGEWEAFVAARGDEWTSFLVAALDGMAHRPEDYEESVCEGEFLVYQFARLPSVLPAERTDALTRRMRAAVGRWPADEPTRAPSVRGLLDDVLVAWVPTIPAARALALLRGGGLSRLETLELLQSVRDEGIQGGDLSTTLASLASFDGDALWAGIASAPWAIPQDVVAGTDRMVLEDSQSSPYTDYAKQRLAPYLRRTERAGWPAARAFVAEGLAAGGRAPERFADVLIHLDPKPDREYVRWVLTRFAAPSEVTARLRSAFQIE